MLRPRLIPLLGLAAALGGTASLPGADVGEGASPAALLSEPASLEMVTDSVLLSDTPVHNPNALQRIWHWSDARVRGVFDYILPDTLERETWRFSFQPRAGDILRHDHIRFPMSLTYGLNRRTEATFGIDPYVANPFKDGEGSGVANLSGGVKYRWIPAFDRAAKLATGLHITHPLSSAPYRFNDGMNRYSIYTTASRPNPRVANLEHFLNLSFDVLTPTAAVGRIREDEPQDDFIKIGTGVLWRKKRFTYGLAVGFAHTTDGVSTSFTTLKPSVVYEVPARYAFNSPGQWQIGAAVEGKHYGDETEVDFKLRLRWDVDFKKVMKDWRAARARNHYAAQND